MNEHKAVWLIDPVHTKIRFETKYLLLTSVSGWFTEFEGTVITAAEDFNNCEIQLTIYTHSITTGNNERDNHLRSADFFDTQNFPTLSFHSSAIVVKQDNVDITGELMIKGHRQSIGFVAKYVGSTRDPIGNLKAGFELSLVLNRKDFDISWNRFFDQSGVLLSDEVKVFCDVQLLKVS